MLLDGRGRKVLIKSNICLFDLRSQIVRLISNQLALIDNGTLASSSSSIVFGAKCVHTYAGFEVENLVS